MAEKLKWGILATGRIAGVFAEGLLHSETGELAAVGSRSEGSAQEFAEKYGAGRSYGSYEELLNDPEVEAVYIATPHTFHAEWSIKAAEAGKHVLCEKPLGINHAQAMAAVEAATENDVFLMEAFMYRCHPQTAELVRLIRKKEIGDVRMIDASFGFSAGFDPESRLFSPDLAGGGILDVGCYCTSMSRLIAGAASGVDFLDPVEVKAEGCLGKTGVDEYTAAVLAFENGIIARISTSVSLAQENTVRIYGTEGSITVLVPWIPAREGGETLIELNKKGAEPETISVQTDRWLYSLEADMVGSNIEQRQAVPPAMTWKDTLGNMKTLDMWRQEIGFEYPMEKPDSQAQKLPVYGRPLSVRSDSVMKYGNIDGLDKKVSRLVMGVDYQRSIVHASVMLDDYFERGGNTFDTAYIYGSGQSETILGQWIRNRDIRDEVVVLDKGAHTPACYPDAVKKEIAISLERMQTDYADIYMLHRDNPEVPVGEFVDVLNELADKGMLQVFGGSNWSWKRLEEANRYAEQNGKRGFSAVSNNFSLARMVDPVWEGCIAASEPEYREWLETTGMPLMPWSSQARGFFVEGRAHPDKKEDPELVRCWYSEDNFRRLERAQELASKKGVLPINIALAYVLCQPFPTFPLIGPRLLEETRTSFPGLIVDLTPEEVRWLNLE